MVENNSSNIKNPSVAQKFARNAIFNVAGFVVTFPVLILLTPYMLNILGKARFGIWAIAAVVTSYTRLSDMGMTTAIVKFVAEHWISRDAKRINQIISTTFFSFAIIGGIVATTTLMARHFIIVRLLKVPLEMQAEALFVVSGIVIIFYMNLLFSVFNSVILGIQRMDVSNAIMVISKILRAFGMYFFLALGQGLKGLIWNSAIFSLFTIALNIIWSKKLLKGLKIRLKYFSLRRFKQIVNYSANIFTANIFSNISMEPTSKLILVKLTSLVNVAFFEIALRIQMLVRQVFQIAIYPILPASSELEIKKGGEELRQLYFLVARMLFFIVLPLFLILIIFSGQIINAWLGDGYDLAILALKIMLVGTFLSLFISPQYIIMQGIGKPHISTMIAAFTAILNIIGCLVLGYLFGFLGIVVGYSSALTLGAIFGLILFEKYGKAKISEIFAQISVRGFISISIFLIILIFANIFMENKSFIKILIFSVVLYCIFVFSLFLFRIFKKVEIEIIYLFSNKICGALRLRKNN